MGSINAIDTPDTSNFPAAVFVQEGDVPIAQCEETQITDTDPAWLHSTSTITADPSIADIDLTGKSATIANSISDDGTYTILAQNGQTITIDHTFAGGDMFADAVYHDTGEAYLTRDVQSFADFIHENGYAYTIKGGKLFTDCPNATLANACSNLWNPGE